MMSLNDVQWHAFKFWAPEKNQLQSLFNRGALNLGDIGTRL